MKDKKSNKNRLEFSLYHLIEEVLLLSLFYLKFINLLKRCHMIFFPIRFFCCILGIYNDHIHPREFVPPAHDITYFLFPYPPFHPSSPLHLLKLYFHCFLLLHIILSKLPLFNFSFLIFKTKIDLTHCFKCWNIN